MELSDTRGVHPSSAQSMGQSDRVRRGVIRQRLAGWGPIRSPIRQRLSVSHAANDDVCFVSFYFADTDTAFVGSKNDSSLSVNTFTASFIFQVNSLIVLYRLDQRDEVNTEKASW